VIPVTTDVFNLPERLAAKADPALIAGDEQHLAVVTESLEQQIANLSGRLDAQRRAPGGKGRQAVDRDLEIHRLTANLRMLQRFGLDLCLGRIVSADSAEPVYIGRLGLTDSAGRQLLIDWRAPAAEPFFAAILAAMVLGQPITFPTTIGGALIAAAVIMLQRGEAIAAAPALSGSGDR